jgi:hypothetical protein
LMHFSAADGAGRHCEPLANAQRDARVFDWLDGYLGEGPIAVRRARAATASAAVPQPATGS